MFNGPELSLIGPVGMEQPESNPIINFHSRFVLEGGTCVRENFSKFRYLSIHSISLEFAQQSLEGSASQNVS